MDYTINDLAVACMKNDILILPVRLYHINQYSLLPLIHKDPFDRMIVATASSEKLTLISKDRQLSAYNYEVIR